MCGIFAYVGSQTNAPELVLNGLKRLEYRGYDSWGIAGQSNNKIFVQKKAGKISDAKLSLPPCSIAVGHTRWATHGKVSDTNAHPHYSTNKDFIVVHNGIVENYLTLKKLLQRKGYHFVSETDTEVIVKLVENCLKTSRSLHGATKKAFSKLAGRNTIILLAKNGDVVAIRNGSPLVIGRNKVTNEIFLSSDTLSFANSANQYFIIQNGEILTRINGRMKLSKSIIKWVPLTLVATDVGLEKFPHYMIKEIHESPYVIDQITKIDRHQLTTLSNQINKARTVYTVGSGTAGVAAAQIAFYLRKFAKKNAISLVGADANEYIPLITSKDLVIVPSQSGETADVLEFLEKAIKRNKVKVASIVNMPGSMITRMSDFKFMSNAGPEICVMSTKVFTSQLAWGYLISKTAAGKYSEGIRNLVSLSRTIDKYLNSRKDNLEIKRFATLLSKESDIFMLGKSENFQIARESMVKIIEGSYIHAHAIPAGDLKHYAITLIERETPVIAIIPNDDTKPDVLNAVNEVKARGAHTIGVAAQDYSGFDDFLEIPDCGEVSSIMNILPFQLLAYYTAVKLGNNVDKPRNIAKSVTVR